MITLKQINTDNIEDILALDVSDTQRNFVASTAVSLAKAYVYRDTAFPFAVYNGDEPVGFIMMGYYEAKSYYTLWEFMIDQRFQGQGYGRQALELGIKYIRERFDPDAVYTGVKPENNIAKQLYRSIGFRYTGVTEDGMEEMRLELR
ncbi:MAG: GNAT family N-acetyltransferase [Clostridiales bacterium]|nr:GNAT family N-acetyltransferase [Clostridiales bacterium]